MVWFVIAPFAFFMVGMGIVVYEAVTESNKLARPRPTE